MKKHFLKKPDVKTLPEDQFNFQEVSINQLIHTIEFVLGAVSNTASYLRLWALSLAHAELSEVFFTLTVKLSLTLDGLLTFPGSNVLLQLINFTGVILLPAFLIWFGLTLFVLLGMETLSAFLHSLRLHWVEFQSKHFKGDGKGFKPLSIHSILKQTKVELKDPNK